MTNMAHLKWKFSKSGCRHWYADEEFRIVNYCKISVLSSILMIWHVILDYMPPVLSSTGLAWCIDFLRDCVDIWVTMFKGVETNHCNLLKYGSKIKVIYKTIKTARHKPCSVFHIWSTKNVKTKQTRSWLNMIIRLRNIITGGCDIGVTVTNSSTYPNRSCVACICCCQFSCGCSATARWQVGVCICCGLLWSHMYVRMKSNIRITDTVLPTTGGFPWKGSVIQEECPSAHHGSQVHHYISECRPWIQWNLSITTTSIIKIYPLWFIP